MLFLSYHELCHELLHISHELRVIPLVDTSYTPLVRSLPLNHLSSAMALLVCSRSVTYADKEHAGMRRTWSFSPILPFITMAQLRSQPKRQTTVYLIHVLDSADLYARLQDLACAKSTVSARIELTWISHTRTKIVTRSTGEPRSIYR